MRQALVIRHVAFEDLGNLAVVLQRHGLIVRYVEAGIKPLGQFNPLTPEVLIVLGGPIGVYQEHNYPFLTDELRLLERRLAADLPTLGICLGGQLMARALGAAVYPGPYKELGWSPLRLSEAGRQSCLAYLAKGETSVLHWHGDTFDLPVGATHLASTPYYENQAFAWGNWPCKRDWSDTWCEPGAITAGYSTLRTTAPGARRLLLAYLVTPGSRTLNAVCLCRDGVALYRGELETASILEVYREPLACNAASNDLAACRSAVSKPSVNQP